MGPRSLEPWELGRELHYGEQGRWEHENELPKPQLWSCPLELRSRLSSRVCSLCSGCRSTLGGVLLNIFCSSFWQVTHQLSGESLAFCLCSCYDIYTLFLRLSLLWLVVYSSTLEVGSSLSGCWLPTVCSRHASEDRLCIRTGFGRVGLVVLVNGDRQILHWHIWIVLIAWYSCDQLWLDQFLFMDRLQLIGGYFDHHQRMGCQPVVYTLQIVICTIWGSICCFFQQVYRRLMCAEQSTVVK